MAGKKNNKVTKKVAKNEAAIAPRFNQSLSAPEEWQHQENGQNPYAVKEPDKPANPPIPHAKPQPPTTHTAQSEIPSKTSINKYGFVTERVVTARLASMRFQILFIDDDDRSQLHSENRAISKTDGDYDTQRAERFSQAFSGGPDVERIPIRDLGPMNTPQFEGTLGERLRRAAGSEEGQIATLCHHREKRDMEEKVIACQIRRQEAGSVQHQAEEPRTRVFPMGSVPFPEHFVKFYEPSPVAGRNVSASPIPPSVQVVSPGETITQLAEPWYEEISEESKNSMESDEDVVYQAPLAK